MLANNIELEISYMQLLKYYNLSYNQSPSLYFVPLLFIPLLFHCNKILFYLDPNPLIELSLSLLFQLSLKNSSFKIQGVFHHFLEQVFRKILS